MQTIDFPFAAFGPVVGPVHVPWALVCFWIIFFAAAATDKSSDDREAEDCRLEAFSAEEEPPVSPEGPLQALKTEQITTRAQSALVLWTNRFFNLIPPYNFGFFLFNSDLKTIKRIYI